MKTYSAPHFLFDSIADLPEVEASEVPAGEVAGILLNLFGVEAS